MTSPPGGLGGGDRSRRRRSLGTLDILGDDAALGAGPSQRAQVDPLLARDPPGQRRGLHAGAVSVCLRGRPRLRLGLLRGGLSAAFAVLVALLRGLALLLALALGDLGLVLDLGLLLLLRLRLGVGHVLALLADDGDRLADLDLLAFAGQDLEQDARGVGLDLLGHLLRVELVERLALLDLVALGLQPAHDRPGLHALAEPRKRDLVGH